MFITAKITSTFISLSAGHIYDFHIFTVTFKINALSFSFIDIFICLLIESGKGELFSSPFVAPNGNVYIGSGEGEILALRQTDGSLVWSLKTKSAIWSSPRLDKSGLLFIGGIDTYLYALRADDGQLVWKYKTDGPVVGTPLITPEHAVPQA